MFTIFLQASISRKNLLKHKHWCNTKCYFFAFILKYESLQSKFKRVAFFVLCSTLYLIRSLK